MGNNDYKYVIDTLSYLLLGTKYTYEEIVYNNDISLKYRTIIRRCFEREVDIATTTLESHLYYMKPEDDSFDIYRRLHARVRVYLPVARIRHGHEKTEYEEHIYKIAELAAIRPQDKEAAGMIIHELQLSKVSLMSFAI